jgi:single stranded DNA-binding protein
MDMQKLILLGRATKDAEKIASKSGKGFAKFGMAVNRYLGTDKGSEVTFYECLVFGDKHAEKAAESIKKGDLLTLDGRPQAEPYLSKDGEAKAALTVVVNSWSLLK